MDDHHLQATKIMKEVFEEHTGITPEVTLEGGYVCSRIIEEQ